MQRRAVTVVLGLVVAIVAVVVATGGLGGSSRQHTVVADFAAATNLVPGANVTAGGETVGQVGSVDLVNGVAAVTLDLSQNSLWPLRQGTRAEIRWGGTVSYSNRYVELFPGPASNPPLADGARLPTADTVTPVEFDRLFNTFDGPTRAALGSLTDRSAATFGNRADAIRAGIDAAAPALTSVSGVLGQLGEDPAALETLVSAGASTAAALRAQQGNLSSLVADAANTFGTIADNASATQATLSKLSPALGSADVALNRLDPTLTKLNTLVDEVRPGAAGLEALARPLGGALSKLNVVAPELDGTLQVLGHGAPAITRLLTTARPVLTAARPALSTLTPMVGCLLHYGPELTGFMSTWASFMAPYDNDGHIARALVQTFPAPNDSVQTPAQLVASNPGLGYALIRPPGFSANPSQTPTYPACSVTTNGINPSADPEAAG